MVPLSILPPSTMQVGAELGFWAAAAIAFMQGFLGSLHCVGMCGPFVHLFNGGAANTDLKSRLLPNTFYNLMRSLSYMSVGFLLGLLGRTLDLYLLSSIAALLGALLMLFFGFSFLFSGNAGIHGIHLPAWISRSMSALLRENRTAGSGSLEGPALMGLLTGFLPCGLLYPAYSLAIGTGEPLAAAFLMFVFSLGTYPTMFTVGLASSTLWKKLRSRWPATLLGLIMILYALYIIYARWSNAGAN